MPRPKRSTTRRAAAPQQNTLAFKSKVTKAGVTQPALSKDAAAKAAKQLPTKLVPKPESVEASDAEDSKAEQAIAEVVPAVESVAQPEPTEEERRAAAVSEAQVRKYWEAKEDCRIFPRVHQKNMGLHDKILREFDLASHYGPCIGIARHKRWVRAHRLGLEPPIEVLAVLLKEEEKEKSKKPSAGGNDIQVAYIDELMGSKQLADEVR